MTALANLHLTNRVNSIAAVTAPDRIVYCDGSKEEYVGLISEMLKNGTLLALNSNTNPRSYLHRSDPSDVAMAEDLTFISTVKREDAGPNNNWMSPQQVEQQVWPLFEGVMRGRTMYVAPYLLGPAGSPYSRVGVQISDSPYVVANLCIMTRMGHVALKHLGLQSDFVLGLHSLGDLSPERRYIVHLPGTRTILSIGSSYCGNALLSNKCHGLRLASVEARRQGWLAEHMAILGLTNPRGQKHYIAAAFPSGCGKTRLATLVPSLPGWQVETVGDDLCWMHVGQDGRLWAINPEAGMFGMAPGISIGSNANAMSALSSDTIFTNVALRPDGTPWWEGKRPLSIGEQLINWRGERWTQGTGSPAAHPNSRFTVSLAHFPSSSGSFNNPQGVPISAILFGGSRAKLAPLVYEAHDWSHGVYMGATMVSERTPAATGAPGIPRNNPMAMLPFCGYNMGDYFTHWLSFQQRLKPPPKIFHVNWFRQDNDHRNLWPGFGENVRVLDWILRRVDGEVGSMPCPLGKIPEPKDLNLSGLELGDEQVNRLFAIGRPAWREEAQRNLLFLNRFGNRLPLLLGAEHRALVDRLSS